MKQKITVSLNKLTLEELKDVLYECIGILGVCDIEETQHALGISRIRVYQIMSDKNTIKIGKHKYLCVNIRE